MPPWDETGNEKSLPELAEEIGLYPVEAYRFVQQGLGYAVNRVHGEICNPQTNRHITGAQLCEGLREYALLQWGLMARTVLRRWNITSTLDFGNIVFDLVENHFLSATEADCLEDFKDVFHFKAAFEADYRIESKT